MRPGASGIPTLSSRWMGAVASLSPRQTEMGADHVDELGGDSHRWIEGTHGILGNEPDLGPSNPSQPALRLLKEVDRSVACLERRCAVGYSCRRLGE